ncbi:MAG TPA: hypothetical protein VGE93_26960, partial [Bryobacteraceae bacterium]
NLQHLLPCVLKQQLRCQLANPGMLGNGQSAEAATRVGRDDRVGGGTTAGIVEVGVVQDIEEFRPELEEFCPELKTHPLEVMGISLNRPVSHVTSLGPSKLPLPTLP